MICSTGRTKSYVGLRILSRNYLFSLLTFMIKIWPIKPLADSLFKDYMVYETNFLLSSCSKSLKSRDSIFTIYQILGNYSIAIFSFMYQVQIFESSTTTEYMLYVSCN